MNKKRLFGAFLIITSLIVMLLPAAEADAETQASAFTVKSGKLTAYKGTDRIVSVPKDVTVIGEGAFENNDSVQKIVLPDSVQKIEAYAFWGCDNLETVTLGKGLKVIDDFAFTNCDGLKSMTIPSNIRSIGIQAFADCNSFEDITIPPEVTDIREDAFDGDYLLNIHCETGSYADKYAQDFYERQKEMVVYENPEEEVKPEVPKDGVYSGADASKDDTAEGESGSYNEILGDVLGSTTVVDNQAVVLMQNAGLPVQNGNEPYEGSSNSQNNGYTGDSESSVIRERAYYRDDTITEAVLPSDIRIIEQFAYARSGLQKLVLPDGLDKIGYAAFYHCDSLKTVEIPESVTSVSAKAFTHTAWVDAFLNGTRGDGENNADDFLISGGVLVAYRGNSAEVTVPEGVRVIAGSAFEGHEEIRAVYLPKSLQNIDEKAFAGCSPQKVEYSGSAMNDELVAKRVSLNAFSAAPVQNTKTFPVTWIVAAIMLLCGSVFVVQKAR